MDPKLHRRIQRQGWDIAVNDYEPLWQAQLADARAGLLAAARLAPAERVLDVACGTGLVTFDAERAVGKAGRVLGVDLAGRMVEAAARRAAERGLANIAFARMDAEALALPDGSFDVATCALGLMYLPDAARALREMRRVLRPGGRMAVAVWGDPSKCGWSPLFPIVAAEVSSDVCPLFFSLGQHGMLARLCVEAGFAVVEERRISSTLVYRDDDQACDAAFLGGPVALAWARFDAARRTRVRAAYLEAIGRWRSYPGYRVPGEFIVVGAVAK